MSPIFTSYPPWIHELLHLIGLCTWKIQRGGQEQDRIGLVCCSPWGHKELDTAERLNWTAGLEALILNFQHVLGSRNTCTTCTVSRVLSVTCGERPGIIHLPVLTASTFQPKWSWEKNLTPLPSSHWWTVRAAAQWEMREAASLSLTGEFKGTCESPC